LICLLPRENIAVILFRRWAIFERKSVQLSSGKNRDFLYIIVETPEGNVGRDINGIYRE